MEIYIYQNNLIGKKQLRQILSWSFTSYDSMQACSLADELKYLGFKYATIAGISISIEDLRVPFLKKLMLEKANQEIINSEKIFLKGKITEVERFQKIIDTWSLTSESLKDQVIDYFKKYDPLNSVYIMAFSGARGNLSQVRQLVGMRGLMSDPSGEIMNLPIKQNFREGLTITDYLISGYGARKGIVDTALKTANSGYLTRRLIDVAQDILIREKDCNTLDSILVLKSTFSKKIIGRFLNKSIYSLNNLLTIAEKDSQVTPLLFQTLQQDKVPYIHIRSPLTCKLYRAVCQKCYGWDLSTENLVDIGEAVGILAGQSIGEPGTQLTMRTFHTGGVFTSGTRQQITSPVTGLIRFSKFLEKVILRTNRGEEVLVTKNSGSLILIPDSINIDIKRIELSRNTILFPRHNQYIHKDTVIGEVINTNKQLKREIKPILSYKSGEIFIPRLKTKFNTLNNNKLVWLLSGDLYNSPKNSYINFYSDYKINKDSYIFRTKIVNSYCGSVKYQNLKKNLYERQILIQNKIYSLKNGILQYLSKKVDNYNSFLKVVDKKYLLNVTSQNFKTYLKTTRKRKFAKLITNAYLTKTGGMIFYDCQTLTRFKNLKKKVYFWDHKENYQLVLENDIILNHDNFENLKTNDQNLSINFYRTLIWLEEEIHNVNCESNILLVKDGDFISSGFEIIPDRYSKSSGLVIVNQKNSLVQSLIIKSGLIYERKNISSIVKERKVDANIMKLFFPGEQFFSTILIKAPSLCGQIDSKTGAQLLIRPIQLYEFPYIPKIKQTFTDQELMDQKLNLSTYAEFNYKSTQFIKTYKQLNLVTEFLYFKKDYLFSNDLSIELINNRKELSVDFKSVNNLNLNNYIAPVLKYKNLESSSLIQKTQFIDIYTTFIYLENITLKSLEIMKFKVNQQNIKQLLLISNNNCISLEKKDLPNKKINDFIINTGNSNYVGRIIIENDNFFTLQKGRPYFFPKCKTEILSTQSNLQYKLIPLKRIKKRIRTNKKLFLNYFNRLKVSVTTTPKTYTANFLNWQSITDQIKLSLQIRFSKMFLRKNGKLYSCMIPRFLKQYNVGIHSFKQLESSLKSSDFFLYSKSSQLKLDRTLLIRNHEVDLKTYKQPSLTFVRFMEYPFIKSTKSIGLHSITEDFFEQELNSVFCQNNQFLEDGYTIGSLNSEKELTGDIVQGLPRIEEILEARKKNNVIKRIPASQKKGLLTQRTSLDESFEFYKLATSIKENEKVNPHKLIKVYFNYYGFVKQYFCDRRKEIKVSRLVSNFEGTYKSFKKVQSFILNSVQRVYESQGVTINDKHLEVIIRQMTTKVLITDEGDTPLLKREVIDLYHIYYINKIIEKEGKQEAYYLPLLFGITRAALNNPSFISAASFQETTRILTKAAIEGRIDWLRGLKENIVIGHLIPAGTGSRNFKTSFKMSV